MAKSIIQKNKQVCYLCGKQIYGNCDEHHIFNGNAYRKKAEEDGLKVYLHHTCHMWLHEHPKSMRTFKQRGQKIYEEKIGSRNEFINRYGKNYLGDNDENI